MLKIFLFVYLIIYVYYTLLYIWRVCQKSQVVRPEGAEALIMNAFALTWRIIIISVYPALPWARSNLGFQPALFEF